MKRSKKIDQDGVHFAHCYQGENENNCKYGDDVYGNGCPAKAKKETEIVQTKEILSSYVLHATRHVVNLKKQEAITLKDYILAMDELERFKRVLKLP